MMYLDLQDIFKFSQLKNLFPRKWVMYCHISPDGMAWFREEILSCVQIVSYIADLNNQPHTLLDGNQRILIDGDQILLVFNNGIGNLFLTQAYCG
jgi:hypothetical protein